MVKKEENDGDYEEFKKNKLGDFIEERSYKGTLKALQEMFSSEEVENREDEPKKKGFREELGF